MKTDPMRLDSHRTRCLFKRCVHCAPPPLQEHVTMKYADMARSLHSARPSAHANVCPFPQLREGRSTIKFEGDIGRVRDAASFSMRWK